MQRMQDEDSCYILTHVALLLAQNGLVGVSNASLMLCRLILQGNLHERAQACIFP